MFLGILILDQTDPFAWAIAFAEWPILAIFKKLSFLNISYFLKLFFAHNNSSVIVESFFACFCEF